MCQFPNRTLHSTAEGLELHMQRSVSEKGVFACSARTAFDFTSNNFRISARVIAAPGPFAVTSLLLTDDNPAFDGVIEMVQNEAASALSQPSDTPPVEAAATYCMNGYGGPACERRPDAALSKTAGTAACGFQIYTDEESQLTFWCKQNMANPNEEVRKETIPLRFDASAEVHNYELRIASNILNTRLIAFFIDGVQVAELTSGIPQFSSQRAIQLQIWNVADKLPPIDNVFQPYTTSARVHELEISAVDQAALEYAKPFLWNLPTPVQYLGRYISLDRNTNNTMDVDTDNATISADWDEPKGNQSEWILLKETCIVCEEASQMLYCDPKCKHADQILQPIDYSFMNVDFESWRDPSENMTNIAIQVKARTPGGYEILSQSAPVLIDFTTPIADEQSSWSYFDVAGRDPFVGVRFQSSNDTIHVQWNIYDPESGIESFEWAIGSTVGSWDVMDFEEVGTITMVKKSGLKLQHNHTYYVTVAAFNRAGDVTMFEDGDGVIVLSEPPSVQNVNVTLPGTEDLPNLIDPGHTVMATRKQDEISVEWTTQDDGSDSNRAEFCVGSSAQSNDILDCIPIRKNNSGTVELTFRNGQLEKDNQGPVANLTELLALASKNKTAPNEELFGSYSQTNQQPESGMHLEPGKHMHYHLKVCNSAMKCREKPTKPVLVMNEGMSFVLPTNHSTREKSSSSLRASNYLIDFNFAGDQDSSSLLVGTLPEHPKFYSDGVTNYKAYIVDAEATIHKTTRLLKGRIRQIVQPTFFVSPVHQKELASALELRVKLNSNDFNTIDVKTNTTLKLSLLYWNSLRELWLPTDETCQEKGDNQQGGSLNEEVLMKVCATQSSTDVSAEKAKFFHQETQFAFVFMTSTLQNHAPVLLNSETLSLTINQLDSHHSKNLSKLLQLHSMDPDGDDVYFSIITPHSTKGRAEVDKITGLLKYTTTSGAFGRDEIWIRLEDQPPQDIPSQFTDYKIPVKLVMTLNGPKVVILQHGKWLTAKNMETFQSLEIQHDGRSENNRRCYEPLQLSVYIYGYHISNSSQYRIQPLASTQTPFNVTMNPFGQPSETPTHLIELVAVNNEHNNQNKIHFYRNSITLTPLADNFSTSIVSLSARDDEGLFTMPIEITVMWRKPAACTWPAWFYVSIGLGVAGLIALIVTVTMWLLGRPNKNFLPRNLFNLNTRLPANLSMQELWTHRRSSDTDVMPSQAYFDNPLFVAPEKAINEEQL